MDGPLLQLDKVSKRYGPHTVLQDVSLALHAGECLALLGHNGAGKTTLLKLLLGLARPSAGEIRVLGAPVGENGVRQHDAMGFLPENIAFPAAMTGAELLGFYAKLKRESRSAVNTLLEAQVVNRL